MGETSSSTFMRLTCFQREWFSCNNFCICESFIPWYVASSLIKLNYIYTCQDRLYSFYNFDSLLSILNSVIAEMLDSATTRLTDLIIHLYKLTQRKLVFGKMWLQFCSPMSRIVACTLFRFACQMQNALLFFRDLRWWRVSSIGVSTNNEKKNDVSANENARTRPTDERDVAVGSRQPLARHPSRKISLTTNKSRFNHRRSTTTMLIVILSNRLEHKGEYWDYCSNEQHAVGDKINDNVDRWLITRLTLRT